MLDGLIAKLRGYIPEVDLLSGDALSEAFVGVLAARLTPFVVQFLVDTRKQLVDALQPEPPATYADELRKIAPRLDPEMIASLWGATYRAICAERVPEKRHLAIVPMTSAAALAEANGRDVTVHSDGSATVAT